MVRNQVCLLILFASVAFGQAQNQSSDTSTGQGTRIVQSEKTDSTKTWNRGHRSRFPNTEVDNSPDGPNLEGGGGGTKAANKSGGLKTIGEKFNSCDIDYGARLDEWRRQIADETVRNLFWYTTVSETLILLILSFYIAYLQREKKLRHIVVVDIVCQLYNSWAFSDNKARSVIAVHNRRIRQMNDEYETRLRGGQQEEPAFEVSAIPPVLESAETSIILSHSFADDAHEEEQAPEQVTRATIPSLAAEKYGIGSKPFDPEAAAKQSVYEALALANKTAASAATQSESHKELERTKAKLKAVEEQNAALRKTLNGRREQEAQDEITPFDKEGQ
jgi:hypothetical protein